MHRLLPLACLLVLAAGTFAEDLPVLKVVNWSIYMDLQPGDGKAAPADRSPILRAFMAAHHCRIDYVEFDNEQEINAYVTQHLDEVDLAIDATQYHDNQADAGAWLAVGPAEIPGLTDLRSNPLPADGSASTTRIPYLWSTSGILYRGDRVAAAPTSWEDLVACPRSAVLDSAPTVFAAALKRRGLSLLKPTPEQLRGAAGDLRDWMMSGRVSLVTADLAKIEASLASGEVDMCLMWSGDAARMIAENPGVDLRYVVPREGSERPVNSWLINPRSQRRALAVALARCLLEPESQVAICSAVRYGVVTNAAKALLAATRPDLAGNPCIEPGADVLGRCEDSSRLNGSDCQTLWSRVCTAAAGP
jgi:spermidine/putrescine transport system substrate-binding protein